VPSSFLRLTRSAATVIGRLWFGAGVQVKGDLIDRFVKGAVKVAAADGLHHVRDVSSDAIIAPNSDFSAVKSWGG
jgi:hypothetical protein